MRGVRHVMSMCDHARRVSCQARRMRGFVAFIINNARRIVAVSIALLLASIAVWWFYVPRTAPACRPAPAPVVVPVPQPALAKYDTRIVAGESITIHDPKPPTAVRFDLSGTCAGTVELDRSERFEDPIAATGATIAIDAGSWSYRLRCPDGSITTPGRIAVVRDAGGRPLPPKTRPQNPIDADGRTWRVTYQTLVPDLLVTAKLAGKDYQLHVEYTTGEHWFTSKERTVTVPGEILDDGAYRLWFVVDGVRQPATPVEITFDHAAPQVYFVPEEWTDTIHHQPRTTIDVQAFTVPGWSVRRNNTWEPLDREIGFHFQFQRAPALVVELMHPERGVHHYIRRPH
jgi:hypothetical protein